VIAGSAALILVQKATGDPVSSFGGIVVPFDDEWWRYLTAPFAYVDIGYLFVVAVALAIFGVGLERRLGTAATLVLMIACGSLGMLAAAGFVNAQDNFDVIAGGNGLALGTAIAWLAVRRAEAGASIEQEYDRIGVAVAVAVLLALPIFESTANVFAGIVGGAVGGVAGLLAAALRPSE
jgi:membrane associated rhomboid family serine protease